MAEAGNKRCRCGKTMAFVWCWDSPEAGIAFNLYACAGCGSVLREDVWDGAGERWLETYGDQALLQAAAEDLATERRLVAQWRSQCTDLGRLIDRRHAALDSARHHVYRAQHDGKYEQDRHDARQWMDDHGGGRCRCDRCERDEARFQKGAV